MRELIRVRDLTIRFGERRVVDRVSFHVAVGEVLGIVGESGSGKTLTSLAIIGLTPQNAVVEGSIAFEGRELIGLSEREMRRIRGREIALIPQNPHSAFNPVFRIGYQVMEPLFVHYRLSADEARERAVTTFRALGISDAEVRLRNYPHELSGGMKQRATISIPMLTDAKFVIADEPTTALDPTIASQILKLLRGLVDEKGKSMIFISHDISAAGWISDRIAVMYSGWIVEMGYTRDVLKSPIHPYTKALVQAMPGLKSKPRPIPGSPLDVNWNGCRFAKRCEFAKDECFVKEPEVKDMDSRKVKCFFPLGG